MGEIKYFSKSLPALGPPMPPSAVSSQSLPTPVVANLILYFVLGNSATSYSAPTSSIPGSEVIYQLPLASVVTKVGCTVGTNGSLSTGFPNSSTNSNKTPAIPGSPGFCIPSLLASFQTLLPICM